MKLVNTLLGQKHQAPPVWMMRQAGRYLPEYRELRAEAGSFLKLSYTPDYATEVTLQPLRRFSFDAAILFSDILVVPHALGMSLDFQAGEGPVLGRADSLEAFRAYFKTDKEVYHQHLSPVYAAVSQIRSTLDADKTLIGFCGAPWTVAAYMSDAKPSKSIDNLKTWAFQNPTLWAETMLELARVSADYLSHQVEAGANVLQIFDSWAASVPAELFEDAVVNPLKEMCRILKERHPHTPVILFPRGVDSRTLESMVARFGNLFDGLGLDYSTPLAHVKHLQAEVTLQGNMDPMVLMTDPDTVRTHVRKTLSHVDPTYHYIFNLGHGVTPQTPIENVAAMVEAIQQEG